MAEEKKWIIYTIEDKPPIGESIFLGIQHYLTMFGATVLIPLLLGGAMKMPPDQLALLISTIFLTSGITTWLQSTIGKTGMAIGAIIGLVLDNIVPGTDEERGLTAWAEADA